MNAVKKFERQIHNNEITDYTLYLTAKPASIQVCMAKHGILVPELCEQANPIVLAELIRCGFAKDKYAEWKKKNALVRRALAENGYFHEELIHDSEYKVRLAVAKSNPAYAKYLVETKSKKEYDELILWYKTLVSVSFNDLEKLIAHPFFEKQERHVRQSIQCKYETRNIKMSAFTKTMNYEQIMRFEGEDWQHLFCGVHLLQLLTNSDVVRHHKDGLDLIADYLEGDLFGMEYFKYSECMKNDPAYTYKRRYAHKRTK